MSKIFISHSSINNASALAIAQWLGDNGWKEYFLDITPAQGLSPGERWQEALKKAADRCEIVLFLISPAWCDSKWCLAEFLLAKQLGKRLFGVLIEPTPVDRIPKEMIAEWQLANLVDGNKRTPIAVNCDPLVLETTIFFAEAGLTFLKQGLQKAGLAPTHFDWPPNHDPNRVPYRGLNALEAEDAAIFFGRDAAIVRGLDELRLMRDGGVKRLFVVLGASGSGKSSYLRAGLYPRLERDDRHFLPLPVIRPEKHAITGPNGLINSLDAAFKRLSQNRNLGDLRRIVGQPGGLDRLIVELQTVAQKRLLTEANPPTIVLSIDQGEELFGADGQDEADAFLSMLSDILSPPYEDHNTPQAVRRRVLGIIAIRSNSYNWLQTAAQLTAVKHNLFDLKPITRDEFKTIIEGPAQLVTEKGLKLVIDPRLTEKLLQDSTGADSLPLLALTLERLYREYGKDGDLLLEEYEKLGGARGSIENAINCALANPDQPPRIPRELIAQENLLRQTFIPWLVSVDQDRGLSRREAYREQLPVAAYPIIERLISARLLTEDRSDMRGDFTTTVEVAHEALLRQWPTLTRWLDQDADRLKILETVRHCARGWERNRRNDEYLDLRGARLKEAEDLKQTPGFWKLLDQQGQEYIAACRLKEDQVKAERASEPARVNKIQEELELFADQILQSNSRLDQALDKATESARIKTNFLAAACHELRAPVNGVIGMTSLLIKTPLTSEQQSYAETIRQCGEAQLQLIDHIAEMGKLEAGKLEVAYIDFNLRTTVEQILGKFAEGAETKGLELTGIVHAAVPTRLKGDPGYLRQVLANLVANAVKFTDKGEVTLQVYLEEDESDAAMIRFEVTDSGIGISSTSHNKIFTPFAKADTSLNRKDGGTGLGLYITKQLVELMGGRIGVRSAEGHGSTFWCTVRFMKQAQPPQSILPSRDLLGKRVLIVDDNESNRMILHHLVTGWGMLDDLAEDAITALHCITEAAQRGIPYDLAILDAVMPGKNGLQLAQELQSHPAGSRIRLVLMTSMLQRDYAEQVHRVGVMGYVPKPVRHDDLRDCIRTVLGLI